jgi:DNA modification methylase
MAEILATPEDGEVRHQEATELLASLAPASAPMIFADPPYGIGYHSNYYKGKNPHAPVAGDWNFQIGEFLLEASRALLDGGALYLCCRWDVTPLWVRQVPPTLKLKSAIAWVKDNWSAGDLTGAFGNQYEQILFLTKGRHRLRGKRWPNVWAFARVPAKQMLHPTQKPIGLVERAVTASTDPGDLVVDPFSGSGTTALAALRTGRRFLVGDIDQEMVKLTRRRIGLPAADEQRREQRPSIDYSEQVDNQFGAPADDLAFLATVLAQNCEEAP